MATKDSQDWLVVVTGLYADYYANKITLGELSDGVEGIVRKHFLQEASKGELEAIKAALANVKSVEYPPSGKEYHFVDGGWSNNLTEAADRVNELRNKFNDKYKEV